MTGFDPRRDYEYSASYESSALYNGFNYPGENNSPWTVELGFDLAANGVGDWFTLDDPVKGVLDNDTYLLAGEVLVDITRWVRRLTVKRGRSRQLEKFVPGTCELVMDNRDRIFDPTMEGSPFFGSIVPRKKMRIKYQDFPVFVGNTQDWDYEYDPKNRDAIATVRGLDGFSYLASQNVFQQTMTAELSGARVEHVLDGLGWPAEQRSIDSGTASLVADVVAGNVNALNYLQKVELSQNGLFFITREGLIRFEDSASGAATPFILGQDNIRFIDYEVSYGAEELYNRVNVSYYESASATATLTADDATSQTAYGVFEVSYDTFLSSSAQASSLATDLLTKFAQPRYRISRVRFDMRGLNSNSKVDVLSMEMGDQILVKYRPSNVGEPLNRVCLIDAIEHEATAATHIITMALTDLDGA